MYKSQSKVQIYNTLSYFVTHVLAAVLSSILLHHWCPSRSALTNPTSPPMSKLQHTHQTYTTKNIIATAHKPIIHNQQCHSRSTLTNPTQQTMSYPQCAHQFHTTNNVFFQIFFQYSLTTLQSKSTTNVLAAAHWSILHHPSALLYTFLGGSLPSEVFLSPRVRLPSYWPFVHFWRG